IPRYITVMTIFEQISHIMEDSPFDLWSWAPLQRPFSIDFYKQWIDEGLHGDMSYLEKHQEFKESPQKFLPQARSALVFLRKYDPHPYSESYQESALRVALYAQGADYHHWFKKEMQQTAEKLKELFPNEEFIALTDSSPVLERDLAFRAGLGWVGKNTCLLTRQQGSLFFIGELYSTLQNPTPLRDAPRDFCGTCTRCLDICPTDAFIAPRKLDASLCISYLTIESKEIPKSDLRPLIGDWFFGCDLCQTVCPWNQKSYGKEKMKFLSEATLLKNPDHLIRDLRWVLTSSNKSLQKHFKGTALSRASGNQLKRNALIVATNCRAKELLPEIKNLLNHKYLDELAKWSINILSDSECGE
ncbi:MAG: tRNA epoxyqueuosine(34) reductase QueG, partial [Bdellovibrionales bacterium]|nr:tRNA epoxyqueuosine(34) reductase QueG [Bdellovibrionales bacterium]